MNKTLKFKSHLAELILAREKTSTWRLFDDKNLQEGDVVDFIRQDTLEKFATVRLTSVIEKPLGLLSEEEKNGHEKYSSDEEMFKTIGGYYGEIIDGNTPIKVLQFELLAAA